MSVYAGSSTVPVPNRRNVPTGFAPSNHQYASDGESNGLPGSYNITPTTDDGFADAREHENVLAGLATDEQMRQLDLIDRLQDLGIDNEGIDLPRLVVCGDQSSGKSSVLTAITGIPFPRSGGTCTRFVTQIILRHSVTQSSKLVSIEPGRDRSPQEQARLKQFRAQVASDFSDLPQIVAAASQAIFNQVSQTQRPEFSQDILKIEISGRDQQPLEILDTPGLINNDKRNGADIKEVAAIVKTHIQKRRSIVLVVVGADTDHRRHSILQTIEDIPDCKSRCFGIITKPDAPVAENLDVYLSLAKNELKGYKFEWGWHVLRNSTPNELQNKETRQTRDAREKDFFHAQPWNAIMRAKPYESAEQCVGIVALRKRVRELLFELNQKELPNVRKEIMRALARHEARLKELGGVRDPKEMKRKLTYTCGRLADLAQDYSRGIYDSRNPLGDLKDEDLKLRSRVRDLDNEFTWTMQNFGHTFAPEHFSLTPLTSNDIPNHPTGAQREHHHQHQSPSNQFRPPTAMTQQQFYAEGLAFLDRTRGEELNTYFDPKRISSLFHRQSDNWPAIAAYFLSQFYDKCEVFLTHALRLAFPSEPDVPERLRSRFLNANIEARKENAERELRSLLDDRLRPVKTYSAEFLTRTRHRRAQEAYKGFNNVLVGEEERARRGGGQVVTPESVASGFGMFSATQHEEAEAARFQDDMLSYYTVCSLLLAFLLTPAGLLR
jgi:GTPase SAR1 family protein